jgi:hypothetical protein
MRSTHLGDPATLGALFFGELWRGRDNLRASLRSLTLRGVPSLAIPLVNLGLLIAAVLALAVAGAGGLPVAAAAGLGIAAFAALRASVMVSRLRPRSLAGSVQALAVAATYDLARALAPVWPTAHAARRRAEAR